MGPFQPGEQVHVVVVEDLHTYNIDENDQPTNHRTELTVYVGGAIVLFGGRSAQLADGRNSTFEKALYSEMLTKQWKQRVT